MSDTGSSPASSSVARILIADDEPLFLRTTGALLRRAGYESVCVSDARGAIEELKRERFDLIISDLNMPGNLKLELLQQSRADWPDIPLIVITGVPSLPTAIESVRLGIADYLLKPVSYDDLLSSVRRALARRDGEAPSHRRNADEGRAETVHFPEMLGESPRMIEVFEILDRVAATDANVLLTGESGVGKEVAAQAVHRRSRRANGNFQIIDCTAIPEALFEATLFGHARGSFTGAVQDRAGVLALSDKGTAFFDEIGELPLPLQAKLLRVIQEQTFTPVGKNSPIKIDTRFICATNRDLELEVSAGRFRRDLYYRLAVIRVELPPLREREDDVLLLAQHFFDALRPKDSPVSGFSDEALSSLRRYSWPGNIRELRNAVEHALALARGPQIEIVDLPSALHEVLPGANRAVNVTTQPVARDTAVEAAEKSYLISLLTRNKGNVARSAREAGLSRQGLHKLVKRHMLTPADYR
jgi:two-component system response regulator HydG